MEHVLDIFRQRGFIDQCTDEAGIYEALKTPATCYIGFDPTARSLHAGSLLPLMSLAHMQRCGHRPIVLIGGGTGLIGDPSGKTEARKIMTEDEINENAGVLKKQFSRFIDFNDRKALLLNNAEWLVPLKYIDFLRDIGKHFSVNRMLAMESVRLGLQRGLSFIEFNYQLLQAYDFWHLFKTYGCLIQMGGSDQWGNIVSGIELIRRLEGEKAFGITFPLLETADSKKMGKTEEGTVWLDGKLTSPYEYYQYWINTDDRDVKRFLSLFTFIPIDEIREIGHMKGAELNAVKTILAFETTKIAHGRRAALKSFRASGIFGKKSIDEKILPSSDIPRSLDFTELEYLPKTRIPKARLEQGIKAYELFNEVGLCRSKGEAKRVVMQGGAYINGKRVDPYDIITIKEIERDGILLRKGKKKYHRVVVMDS